jgi:hypothetical protein
MIDVYAVAGTFASKRHAQQLAAPVKRWGVPAVSHRLLREKGD